MDWGDALSALSGALVTAAIGTVGFLERRRQLRRDNYRKDLADAAGFLSAVAESLDGMVTEFGQGRIPRTEGHSFERLLKGYDDRLRRHLSSHARDDLDKLRGVSKRARELDDDLYLALQEGFELDKAKSNTLINEMERLVGDLQGEADLIKNRSLGK